MKIHPDDTMHSLVAHLFEEGYGPEFVDDVFKPDEPMWVPLASVAETIIGNAIMQGTATDARAQLVAALFLLRESIRRADLAIATGRP